MSLVRRLFWDDGGGETLDYAMVLGLVALGSVTAVTAASGATTGWWTNIATSFTTFFGTG